MVYGIIDCKVNLDKVVNEGIFTCKLHTCLQ